MRNEREGERRGGGGVGGVRQTDRQTDSKRLSVLCIFWVRACLVMLLAGSLRVWPVQSLFTVPIRSHSCFVRFRGGVGMGGGGGGVGGRVPF